MKSPATTLLLAAVSLSISASAGGQNLADVIGGCGGFPPQRTIAADPSNYRPLLSTLAPGDRLLLAAGTYPLGLPISDLHGAANNCIAIEGPGSGPPAVFTGSDVRNTVSIRNASYLAVRNLELDGLGLEGDGVKAESESISSHHITLENLYIHGHGGNQQIVGINTKSPAWNWVIRRNRIVGAGTGIYLGNSDGSDEFVNSLIEHNLVRDTIGYNLQIKHQVTRSTGLGLPTSGATLIRHNVFSKAQGASTGANARPNLLVGHWPLAGAGSSDVYQIYGNLFHQNPVEALFQGEGNVALYDNLFVNDFASGFPAVAIGPHNDVPRGIEVFHNTVVAAGPGISVTGGHSSFQQRVRGNAVFASPAIQAPGAFGNATDVRANAGSHVANPFAPIGSGLDLYPRAGQLTGSSIDMTGLTGFRDWDRDFNGSSRPSPVVFRGAYSGEGANPGWTLALDVKPEPAPSPVTLVIDDVTLAEGSAGSRRARFTVTLSTPAVAPVTVDYATSDGTATAGSDYDAAAGSLSFPPGTTSRSILVSVLGDFVFEADETFFVDLTNAAGATLLDDRGDGIITNDDAPGLTVADVTLAEPAAGTAAATFTVTLSPPSGSTVTVDYQTVDDSATSPADFQSQSGSLFFPAATTNQTVDVTVSADILDEGIERFFFDLAGSTGAPIARSRATGTIYDDGAFFTVDPCRVVDTREPPGPGGGPALQAGTPHRTFTIAGACRVPPTARAVSVNVAVTGSTAPGHLRLYAAGTQPPIVSAINYAAAATRSNNAVVPLSVSGELSVFVGQASGTVHFILDVNGYFE